MLLLVLANRHPSALVQENISCLKDRICVETERHLSQTVRLEFELVHVAQLGHGHFGAEYPG